jgi:UDP-N-acetylmuramoyl-L-alanyl-D-glutamate--2,6-diaminopimelate ligase
MTLTDLLAGLPVTRLAGNARVDHTGVVVTAVTDDSREVTPGAVFVAVRGAETDGHHFVGDAFARGAAAIVVEDDAALPAGATGIVVPDSRAALADLAHRAAGDPTRALALVGITGTNGKTTTAYLVESILAAAGLFPGMIGTVAYRWPGREIAAGNTTPGAASLASRFAEMVGAGCRAAVFEVSSHALDQRRALGCHLDVACFTNLTRDHLDYHGDEANYFQAKRRLFEEVLARSAKPARTAVVNLDDPYGRVLAADLAALSGTRLLTYSIERPDAEVRVREATTDLEGVHGLLDTPAGAIPFESALVGRFNLSNVAAAAACALGLSIDPLAIASGIGDLPGVPGRLQRIEGGGVTVLVDYAHTGDALTRAIAAVRELRPARLLTVFGCGGDRDRGKRPIMGNAAASGSDLAIVTSDNPRTEDPRTILDEVLPGVIDAGSVELSPAAAKRYAGSRGYIVEPDRRAAIHLAVRLARAGDVVLIAGKGHEDYQILGRTKVHFDDREEARAALAAKGKA